MQKVQLHSEVGYAVVGVSRFMTLFLLLAPIVWFLVDRDHLELPERIISALEGVAGGVALAMLDGRLSWRAYAREEGLELDSSKKVIPWEEVEELRDLGLTFSCDPVRMLWLSFRSKRRGRMFYAHRSAVDDFNRMRTRCQKRNSE